MCHDASQVLSYLCIYVKVQCFSEVLHSFLQVRPPAWQQDSMA
jgi:hypothetical protein